MVVGAGKSKCWPSQSLCGEGTVLGKCYWVHLSVGERPSWNMGCWRLFLVSSGALVSQSLTRSSRCISRLSRRLHIQEADEKKETTCRYRIQGSRWSTQTKPVSSLGLGFLIRATQPAKLTSHGVKSVLALGRELGGHRTCALGTGPTS